MPPCYPLKYIHCSSPTTLYICDNQELSQRKLSLQYGQNASAPELQMQVPGAVITVISVMVSYYEMIDTLWIQTPEHLCAYHHPAQVETHKHMNDFSSNYFIIMEHIVGFLYRKLNLCLKSDPTVDDRIIQILA